MLGAMFAGSCVSMAATMDVRARLDDVASADLAIVADGKTVCSIKLPTRDAGANASACSFELPANARALTVRGKYETAGPGRHMIEGTRSFAVLDLAEASKALTASSQAYGARVAEFANAVGRIAQAQLPGKAAPIKPGKSVDQASVDAAQKRLGFELPADFVSLELSIGAVGWGDNEAMPMKNIDNAYAQMRNVWGTPEDAMQEDYSESMRTLLRKSVLLFTETGDGYGGLLFKPGASKACGEQGTYYWTSQEGGTHVLKNADASCMDFRAAFRWVLDWLLLDSVSDAIAEDAQTAAVLLDSSTARQVLDLQVARDSDRFSPSLRGYWKIPYDN